MSRIIPVLLAIALGASSAVNAYFDEKLALTFGPWLYQDVDIKGEPAKVINGLGDFIARLDEDFEGDNNWENLIINLKTGTESEVYAAVIKTSTHWFFLFAVPHQRDWDDEKLTNQRYVLDFGAPQHENDLEGIFIIVRQDSTIEAFSTMAHNRWLNYPVAPNVTVKPGYTDDRQGEIPAFIGRHIKVFIQAEGHGIYGCPTPFNEQLFDPSTDYFGIGVKRWDLVDFPDGTGIIYFPSPVAQIAKPMFNDPASWFQSVGYQPLSLEVLWELRHLSSMFTPNGHFKGTNDGYDDPEPNVNNPQNDNLAQAPWAWQDRDGPVGEVFFDPAKFASRRFDFGGLAFDEQYTPNNPSWIKSALVHSLVLEVLESEPLGPRIVSIDKYIAPTIRVSWDKQELSPDYRFTSVGFFWNGESPWAYEKSKYPASYLVYEGTTACQGELGRYLSKDGYLFACLRLKNEQTKERYELYTDTLWVKLEPHRFGIYVSPKDGSDQTGNGTRLKPLSTLTRGLGKARYYYYAPKSSIPSKIDTIYLSPGDYPVSPSLDFPVAIIGSGAYRSTIGTSKRSIGLQDNESNRTSLIQGLTISTQIWAYKARVKIKDCRFTPDNWNQGWVKPLTISDEWALNIQECSPSFELVNNTFDVKSAILSFDSNPNIYSNLFTKNCQTALWVYQCRRYPQIGGSQNRANAFLGSDIFTRCSSKIKAYYNWWGTTDEEELQFRLGQFVDYRNFLKSPPPAVGAPNPSDFDGDGQVGLDDFTTFIPQFGTKEKDKNWDSRFDLNADGRVNLDDFLAFIQFLNP